MRPRWLQVANRELVLLKSGEQARRTAEGRLSPHYSIPAASPATIAPPCAPWPTSSRDTLPTTSRCCAGGTCREIFSPCCWKIASTRRRGPHPLKTAKGPVLSLSKDDAAKG